MDSSIENVCFVPENVVPVHHVYMPELLRHKMYSLGKKSKMYSIKEYNERFLSKYNLHLPRRRRGRYIYSFSYN